MPAIVLAGAAFLLLEGTRHHSRIPASFIDLTAAAGYARATPSLPQRIPGRSSGFGRLSAYGVHEWRFGERRYHIDQRLCGTFFEPTRAIMVQSKFSTSSRHTSQALSPTVTVFGNLTFTGDFAGQLVEPSDLCSQPTAACH